MTQYGLQGDLTHSYSIQGSESSLIGWGEEGTSSHQDGFGWQSSSGGSFRRAEGTHGICLPTRLAPRLNLDDPSSNTGNPIRETGFGVILRAGHIKVASLFLWCTDVG